MSYQVTARKWRPMIFDDVVGQAHVTNTLRNAIISERVAHAYIFSGTRGCGKTTTARILARTLNCLSPVNQNPDNTCEICKEIIEGRSLDVIEIDGASNRGVEEIRNLRDSVRYTATRGKYKIYIIDEVHMLTKEAFNALLKTLEEPPARIVFIFATTEIHKVPMTILSRCQRFDFRRISIDEIISTLSAIAGSENVKIEQDALMVIAKKADGSLRDAQSIFDQVQSFCGSDIKTAELLKAFNVVDQEVYFKISDLLKNRDASGAVKLVDEIIKSGYDLREFVGGMIEHLRNLLIVNTTGSTQLIDASEQHKKRFETEAKEFSEQDILRYLKQAGELDQALKWSAQPRYRLESGLIQMVKMEKSVEIGDLLRQIELMKKKASDSKNAGPAVVTEQHTAREKNVSTELKVVGAVGAGYLKTKSAVSYSHLIGTDLSKAVSFTDFDESHHTSLSVVESPPVFSQSNVFQQSISTDEMARHWPAFINNVSKSHIAVGTSLTETCVLDVQNGMVRISCPDDYHVSTLKRHKDLLTNALHQVVGKRIVIEPILHSSIPVKEVYTTMPADNIAHNGSGNISVKKETKAEGHPILELLKRELGAERVE